MKEIDFPPQEYVDGISDLIVFPAVVEGRELHCAVEVEALQEAGYSDFGDPLPAFHAHRPEIEEAAARLIQSGRFTRGGMVVVTAQDL